jgi:uncharacterized metal-binding protein YceD (DUF177 family)
MMAKLGSVNAPVESDDEVGEDSPFAVLKGLFDKKN